MKIKMSKILMSMPLDEIQSKCGLQRKSTTFIDFVYEYTVIKLKLNKVSIWVSNILDINFNKVKKTFWFCHFNLYFHGTWVFVAEIFSISISFYCPLHFNLYDNLIFIFDYVTRKFWLHYMVRGNNLYCVAKLDSLNKWILVRNEEDLSYFGFIKLFFCSFIQYLIVVPLVLCIFMKNV